jgi:hypothetical protein
MIVQNLNPSPLVLVRLSASPAVMRVALIRSAFYFDGNFVLER